VREESSEFRVLPGPFGPGGDGVLGCFAFAVALADLLLDFLGDAVDGGVHVALVIDGKKIRSTHPEAHGARKLFSGVRVLSCSRVTRASMVHLSRLSSLSSRARICSSMALVSVTLWVERMSFIFPKMPVSAREIQFFRKKSHHSELCANFACRLANVG